LRTTTWPDGGLGDNLLDTIFVTSRKFVPSFSHTILRYAMFFYVQASVAVLEPPLEATGEVRGERKQRRARRGVSKSCCLSGQYYNTFIYFLSAQTSRAFS
jgi:hypothetical protein